MYCNADTSVVIMFAPAQQCQGCTMFVQLFVYYHEYLPVPIWALTVSIIDGGPHLGCESTSSTPSHQSIKIPFSTYQWWGNESYVKLKAAHTPWWKNRTLSNTPHFMFYYTHVWHVSLKVLWNRCSYCFTVWHLPPFTPVTVQYVLKH